MSVQALDRRLNAYRDDLADIRLKEKVEAERFVTGRPARVTSHFLDIHSKPDAGTSMDAQVLYGHSVLVFESRNGWSWIQSETDGYVGYVQDAGLGNPSAGPTHIVSAPRTFLYSRPDLKSPRSGYRSIGSQLTIVDQVTTRGTNYAILDTGQAVIASHLIEQGDWCDDYVSVAETLLHAPYLWGGNTGFGLDCSGLVWLGFLLCGKPVLRDSDMMARSIGEEIEPDPNSLKRGDLVFWNGHVGIMKDDKNLLHANGHTMNVAEEPLTQAIERIGYLYGQPTVMRRPH